MKNIYLTLREILEKKPGIYSSIVFVVLLIIISGASIRVYDLTVAEERQKTFYAGDAFRDQMELTLNHGLSATQTIALMIEHGSLPASFERVAEKILYSYPVLNAIELGPNGIVSHVYPYEQNKNAIGFNILSDPVQKAEAKEAVKKQKLIFAGPLKLVQGGIGVVGRLPVFITDRQGKHFWGFSLVVIKIDRLLTLAKVDELKSKGYEFQLRRMVSASSTVDTFANKHMSLVDPVILKVNVPNGQWELLVAPAAGWNAWGETIPFAASRFALSCLLALFVWYVGKQPEKLSKLVTKRTEELKFSEAKFQTYVENAPNIITIVDSKGSIKYLNKVEPGTTLSDYTGKNIFDVILPEHHKNVRGALDAAFQKQTMSFYLTSAFVHGQTYWYENMVGLLNPVNAKGDLIITSTNITERKKAEASLVASELYNRSLIETSPSSITITDLNGNLIYANAQALQIYGHEPNENILGKNVLNWVPNQNRSLVQTRLVGLLNGELVRNFELQLLKFNGEIFWAEVNASLIVNKDGAPANFLVISSDITKRKNAEIALRESENRYRTIVENLRQAYYESNKMSVFTYCNPGLIILSGYSEKELLSRSSFRIVADEHRQMVINSYKKWITEKQIDMSLEFKVQTKNRNKYWVEQTTHFDFDERGQFIKATNFVKDITERKISEEKLRMSESYNRALINTIPDLLFVHDLSGTIMDYHAPSSIPLLLPPEHFLGKHYRDFLPPDVTMIVDHGFQQALQTKKMCIYTYSLSTPEGRRHYEARLLTFEGDKVLNIIRDITEKVRAEHEIRLMNIELEDRVARRTAQLTEANKELEAFSYSVSHDLRAPLRSIDGYTAILNEQYSDRFDDEGKRLLSNVLNSISKMDVLIKGLLNLSRLGRSELRIAEHSMEPLVRTIVEECSTEEQRKRITFNILSLPSVLVDLSLIRQAWTNLISNAIKYSGKREHALIEIGATKEIGRIVFHVRDNGAGFDPKFSNKLFGIFQRLHVDDEFKGLGIGLSIVKRIVQRHGGTVWAEGRKNEGATFYFSIPTTAQE